MQAPSTDSSQEYLLLDSLPRVQSPSSLPLMATLVTDRAVYKANDTVKVKGYVREQRGGKVELPTSLSGSCSLSAQWERGRPTAKLPVVLSPNTGTFDAEVTVPADATYTEHTLALNCEGKPPDRRGVYASARLAVADPRPPTVELQARAAAPASLEQSAAMCRFATALAVDTVLSIPP